MLLTVAVGPGCGGGGLSSVSFLVVGVGFNGTYAAPVGAGIAGAPGRAVGYEVDDVVVVEGCAFEVDEPSEA